MASLPEKLGSVAGSSAARTKWLARGAWLLALAEVAVVVKDHLAERLDNKDRDRLVEIVRTSKGRPSNLSIRERRDLKRILDKVEPGELVKGVAQSAGNLRNR